MMDNSSKSAFATIAKVYLGLDVVWAIICATLASIVAGQGLAVTNSGAVAATTGGIGAWIAVFFVSLFQGAIFLVVFSVFGAIIVGGVLFLSKDDPKLRTFFGKVAKVYAILDALWAALAATFFSSLLFHVGTHAGASVGATKLGAVLAWLISFIAAAAQGAIFLTVATVFVLIILVVVALLTGEKKS